MNPSSRALTIMPASPKTAFEIGTRLTDDFPAGVAVAAGVASIAAQLDDAKLRARINRGLEERLSRGIPAWRDEIKGFITGTLQRQDVATFTRRLELRVGKDLQFIRINGTVLGALIGGALYALHVFLN